MTTVLCPSTIHDEDGEPHPPATVAGIFSSRSLNARPDERTVYCERCARGTWFGGFFRPDDPADVDRFREWERQIMAEAKEERPPQQCRNCGYPLTIHRQPAACPGCGAPTPEETP